jgi:hypothetical protein
MAGAPQLRRAGKRRRPRAYARYFQPRLGRGFWRRQQAGRARGVGRVSFQKAYGDRAELFLKHARALAMTFLRADAAAYRRQKAGFHYFGGRAFQIFFQQKLNKGRYFYIDGAGRLAPGVFAVEAAPGFKQCFFFAEALGDFAKIFYSFPRGLAFAVLARKRRVWHILNLRLTV